MDKKIRSISISYGIDEKLILDSKSRGLTISANITRILFDYFKNQPKETDRILKLKFITNLLKQLFTLIGINVSI